MEEEYGTPLFPKQRRLKQVKMFCIKGKYFGKNWQFKTTFQSSKNYEKMDIIKININILLTFFKSLLKKIY